MVISSVRVASARGPGHRAASDGDGVYTPQCGNWRGATPEPGHGGMHHLGRRARHGGTGHRRGGRHASTAGGRLRRRRTTHNPPIWEDVRRRPRPTGSARRGRSLMTCEMGCRPGPWRASRSRSWDQTDDHVLGTGAPALRAQYITVTAARARGSRATLGHVDGTLLGGVEDDTGPLSERGDPTRTSTSTSNTVPAGHDVLLARPGDFREVQPAQQFPETDTLTHDVETVSRHSWNA